MPTYKKKTSFSSTEEIAEVQNALKRMVENNVYNTQPSFSANSDRYPNNLIPFIDKHMEYLMSHKGINPQQYVSNLRLMTRIK